MVATEAKPLTRGVLLVIAMAVAAALLVACGTDDPTPAPTPTPTPVTAPGDDPPVDDPPVDEREDWEVQWDEWVENAAREGEVIVTLFRADDREAVERFEEAFPEIRVEAVVISGRDFSARVPAERQAGRYNYDVYMSGGTTAITDLIPAGIQTGDPILGNTREILIRPDVYEDENWIGRFDDHWIDSDTKNVLFKMIANPGTGSIWVNTREISPDAIRTPQDLLNPEFAGRLCADDPASPGAGATFFTEIGVTEGPDFVRRLFSEQEWWISTDGRRMAEELIRGQMVGCIGAELDPFHAEGVTGHLHEVNLELGPLSPELDVYITCCGVDEGDIAGFYSAGIGGPAIVNNAPNPYAARVFINWLLTRDGQEAFHSTPPAWLTCSPHAELHQMCDAPFYLEEGKAYVTFHDIRNVQYRALAQSIAAEELR